MKVLMKPVEMVARFSQDGTPRPVKYRVTLKDEPVVIQVDKVLFRTEETLAGNRRILYRCQSEINGVLRLFELKYELSTCRWFLFKL
ncbi:hypothetical protein [Desulfosporosinus youngiae]|uniref:Uncharacterized protein n=1 Tax=Desulfosporosinus youngiae DSM 17734 TaxID=768710 RepID=H5XY38_9FIRM|nr:hypothetical protein [Desulfosporosinus youngiae]EHQ91248.1 hypothetical protein DesyoDRAFT_4293 [Desulfosporosinus youngiae DSM 17734]